jgi:succinyl-CoA synthetase beta subunit
MGDHGHHQALRRQPGHFLAWAAAPPPEKVTEAFKIMLKNPKLKAILVQHLRRAS